MEGSRIVGEHQTLSDLQQTERLTPRDACEFRYPARDEWRRGFVVFNGGSGYWHVEDAVTGDIARGLYIEHVRAPGTNPWPGTSSPAPSNQVDRAEPDTRKEPS
jgi:hypothetical protein